MNKQANDIYLTVEELADVLKITRSTVYEWKKLGLPYIKIGKTIRFDSGSIEQWVKSQEKRDNIRGLI